MCLLMKCLNVAPSPMRTTRCRSGGSGGGGGGVGAIHKSRKVLLPEEGRTRGKEKVWMLRRSLGSSVKLTGERSAAKFSLELLLLWIDEKTRFRGKHTNWGVRILNTLAFGHKPDRVSIDSETAKIRRINRETEMRRCIRKSQIASHIQVAHISQECMEQFA